MTDLLKIVEPLITLFLGQRQMISEKSLQLTKEILNQLRRVVSLISMLIGSLILFCLGMSYFIDRTLDQLDRGDFSLTPSLIFLLVFMLICLALVFYSTNKNVWIKILKKDPEDEEVEKEIERQTERQKMATQHNNPIEAAISLFILDLVKERELSREINKTNPSTSEKLETKKDMT